MTCSEIQRVLARLAGCDGAPRVALEAARHLAGCQGCAETLLRLRQVSTMLDELPRVEVPPSFSERVLRALPRRARDAGGVLVLAAIALLGAAFSLGSVGSSVWAKLQTPLESATTTVAALLALFDTVLEVIRSALGSAEISFPRIPGAALDASLPSAALAAFAVLTLAASCAAFGRGAFTRVLRESRYRGRAPSREDRRFPLGYS